MHHQSSSAHGGHMMPPANSENARALIISGWLTGIYFVVELGIGIWTGSISVLSDAFHTFSAVGGVLIALVAGRLTGGLQNQEGEVLLRRGRQERHLGAERKDFDHPGESRAQRDQGIRGQRSPGLHLLPDELQEREGLPARRHPANSRGTGSAVTSLPRRRARRCGSRA